MQPKRDPNDRRYWPNRKGGTGGFSYDRKLGLEPPRAFSALSPRSTMSIDASNFDNASKRPTVATRERARLILDRALDRLGKAIDDVNPLTVNEIAGAVNALAKVSGVTSIQVEVSGSVAHLHLAALQAPRISATAQLDTPLALSNDTVDTPHTEPIQGEQGP